MRAFFYHIRLEIYEHQRPGADDICLHLPAPGSDLFSDRLPTHATSQIHDNGFHRPDKPLTTADLPHCEEQPPGHNDALLLPERNAALRNTSPSTARPASEQPSQDIAIKDWRFGPVSIDSIDMVNEQHSDPQRQGKSPPAARKTNPEPHTKAIFVPSDVKTTNIGSGVVHLYRDTHETDLLTRTQQRRSADQQDEATKLDLDQCTTLCILAVPSWMMPSDLLGFVGDQTRTDVSHFRLVRTGRANKYMVLMKFRQAKRAREWQDAWNGRLFSAMEPENCHVVFVKSVDFISDGAEAKDFASFPLNTSDSFMPTPQPAFLTTSTKPYAPPTPSLIELPTCPVCLERMDETTGLLTILCQHVFHCACLEKWRGSGCPVCRYTQSPSYTFPYPRPGEATSGPEEEPLCSVCATSANLWVCLICGNTGCGRYDSAHAHAHYEATSHCYAMDITTQRVWDYAGDGYVHRLIQNKENSKLIGLPGARHDHHPNNAFRAVGDDSVPREKMEAMATEYTFLLTNQLDSQRRYFEEQLERAVDKASTACTRAEAAAAQASSTQAELAQTRARAAEHEDAISRLEKAVERTTTRSGKFENMSRDLMRQVKEETAMNEGLMKRIKAAEERYEESDRTVAALRIEKLELEEMNRDLTIFISSRDKIQEMQSQGEEVQGASVAVPEQPQQAIGSKRKGKSKK